VKVKWICPCQSHSTRTTVTGVRCPSVSGTLVAGMRKNEGGRSPGSAVSSDRFPVSGPGAARPGTENRSPDAGKVHRPWGWFEAIDRGELHQVKRLFVNPGAKLSVQMHHHRAEHWVVVRGTARVTRGDAEIILVESQSVDIPLATLHSVENPGETALEIIEVQYGSYLGEDDIVRFEDRYGRADT